MIKCEVIEKFDLKDFDKLSNIKRKSIDVKGSLFVGDIFECDEKMADYLTGNNALNKVVVKVIEIVEEVKSIFDTKVENESIIPLDEKKLEEVKKQIQQHIQQHIKVSKKKKSSKK